MIALTVTASEIHAEHEAAQRCAGEAVAHAIRAGELLAEAKSALPHGEFGDWLAANVKFSDRTARGYMRLAGLDEAKRQRVADMSLRGALRSIAEPATTSRPTLSQDALAAMSDAERYKHRRSLLEYASRLMQEIIDERDIPPTTDRQRALEITKDCERMLMEICTESPPGQFPLGMMVMYQCADIKLMLESGR